jgi:Family of unknown function (DUF5309)
MAKPADYWQARDLSAVDFNGLINEDVMQQIWDISTIPLPLMDAIGSDSVSAPYTEWTTDKLAAPVLGGWVVDGSDSDKNNSAAGKRIGNQCGILTKEVQVSDRAQSVDTIGRSDELSYQLMMRQRELKRDIEANLLGIQGSVADDGNTTPGNPAGLAAMVTKTVGASTGTGGAFSTGAWSAWTPGAVAQGLTETLVRDAAQSAWESGADPSLLMTVPSLCRKLSEYMFGSSARIATLSRETKGEDNAATALGSVNVFITDFGVTLTFVPNRLQQTYLCTATPAASLFILDPAYARVGYLKNVNTRDLATVGLTDKRLMSADFTLKVLNPDAHRVIPDCNPATAVVA